jgi:uncharacterized Zn-binding protein involved in type VI secretion
MKPAARLTDAHVCPQTSPSPHGGGAVTGPGASTVLIENLPAACLGDSCACAGPPNAITAGASTILVADKPAARLGDSTAHGGAIAAGSGTVLFGD